MFRMNTASGMNKKNNSPFVIFIFKIIILSIFISLFINTFILTSYRVNSISMEPLFCKGEMLLSVPFSYGIKIPFISKRIITFEKPKRGDIAIISLPFKEKTSFLYSTFWQIANIFSLKNNDQISWNREKSIKRIIGIPGDIIRIENFIVYIKPANQERFYSEHELIRREYEILYDNTTYNQLCKTEFPGSGNIESIILNENEYFILGDNRFLTNDSRSWGKIDFADIQSIIIFRYFPIKKLGMLP